MLVRSRLIVCQASVWGVINEQEAAAPGAGGDEDLDTAACRTVVRFPGL